MAFASPGFYKWGLPSKRENTAKFTQPKPPLPEEYNRNRIPVPAGKITPTPTGCVNPIFPKNSGSIYGFPKAAKFIPLPNPPPQKYNTAYLQPPMGRNTPVPNKHLVSNVFDALHEKEADDKPAPEQSVLETATILNKSNPSSYLKNVISELTMLEMRSKVRNLTRSEINRKNKIETEFNEGQEQLREIDRQKKVDDPTFKGAFHKKTKKFSSKRSFEDKFSRTKERQKRKKRRK